MTIEEMRRLKREYGLTNQYIADKSGVPLGTVQKIFGGATTSPRRLTLSLLEDFFNKTRAGADLSALDYSRSGIRESSMLYKATTEEEDRKYPRQGDYTVKDYMALPDDQRVELIDGVIYDMGSSLQPHQIIAGEIHYQMKDLRRKTKSRCMPFIAPSDVQLDRDEKTMVQPDVYIVCNYKGPCTGPLFGAPDLVLEVISKSSRQKDSIIKLNKYMHAGCREYWLVDPENEAVLVYDFENGKLPEYHSFDEIVPVGISGGEWVIDFTRVKEELEPFPVSEADPHQEENE